MKTRDANNTRDIRKNVFSFRAVGKWNRLDEKHVEANLIRNIKFKYDKTVRNEAMH